MIYEILLNVFKSQHYSNSVYRRQFSNFVNLFYIYVPCILWTFPLAFSKQCRQEISTGGFQLVDFKW